MRLSRTVTIVTANLGRGVSNQRFRENVLRLKESVPGKHVFYGFQEIDEADGPAELSFVKETFGETHYFAGTKTNVPLAIPKTFEVTKRTVTVASEGVDKLSPRRHVVEAVVHPEDHPDRKVIACNTHFARVHDRLSRARLSADEVLRQRIHERNHALFLTGDLNAHGYRPFHSREQRWVTARMDYVRGYEADDVDFRLLNTGTVNLTIDGHNAHWARVQITWA